MLEVRGLAASYGKHQALAAVDLDVKPGEIVVMLGANGAGKSTLLKAIAGLVRPQAGSRETFDGRDLVTLPPPGVRQGSRANHTRWRGRGQAPFHRRCRAPRRACCQRRAWR